MKVYNEEKTEVLETCDLTKGFLKTDKILKVQNKKVVVKSRKTIVHMKNLEKFT